MKKIVSLILAIAIFMSVPLSFSAVSDSTVTASIESLSGVQQGETIQLKLFIESRPIWSGIDIQVEFNVDVFNFVSFVINPELADQRDNGEPCIFAVNKDRASEGIFFVGFATASSVGGYEGYYPGEYDYLGTIKLTVKEDAPIGESELALDITKLCDKDLKDVPFETSGGKVDILCAHNWEETASVDATCEEEGSVSYTCSKCGEEKSEVVAASGHVWKVENVVAPTCEAEGYTVYVCENNADHTYTSDTVAPLGHVWKEISRTEATCSATGEIVYECINDATHVKTETIDIDPEAHEYEERVTLPTCEAEGYTTYTCKHNPAHTYVSDEVEPLGHVWKEISRTEATCSAAGEIVYECINDATHVKTETIDIDPEAHEYEESIVLPTCETEGYLLHTCKHNPEHSFISDVEAALGHKFGKWVITKEATREEDGIMTRTCETDPAHTEEKTYEFFICGDIDEDEGITVADALATLRVAAQLTVGTERETMIADIDGDGALSVADALAILRVAAKLSDGF